ncbi:hypothetical protein CCR75_006961 [Bremia lactucae]|uniref:Uncharacterized protein n=1 Tax=Bremia lactucae TaxID=4779 RepID=A0A976FLS7_BRELC|nr:hypothetical protein CCR75_006961 [Bremia lactucae]
MEIKAIPPLHQRFQDYLQTNKACEKLYQRQVAALRAQLHDLSELLAAFELCDIKDTHLKTVRDRAFHRDIGFDTKKLELCLAERQLQEEILETEFSKHPNSMSTNEASGLMDTNSDIESLQLRVEVLEREVAHLHLRHELLFETKLRPESESPKASAAETKHLTNPEKTETFEKLSNDMTKTINGQQEKIIALEKALAFKTAKFDELMQQNSRYNDVEKILKEFSQSWQ